MSYRLASTDAGRDRLVRRGLWLAALTITWNVVQRPRGISVVAPTADSMTGRLSQWSITLATRDGSPNVVASTRPRPLPVGERDVHCAGAERWMGDPHCRGVQVEEAVGSRREPEAGVASEWGPDPHLVGGLDTDVRVGGENLERFTGYDERVHGLQW